MPLFAPWRIPEIWRIWVLCTSLIAYSHSSKLNVPKLLLPYSTHASVNFTLKAETGCYTWESSHPDLVSVLPLSLSAHSSFLPPSSCSQHALVSALPTLKTPTQMSAIVLAKNTATGQILRCDVYISYIRSIQILTTTHQIFTDDPPLQLSVQALDSKGNTFSSLAGLEFEWHAGKEHDAPGRVRFLPYSEAGYCPSPHILSLEKAGHRGEDVLLLGLESGPALIYVSLKHPEYEHVDPVSVSLSIIDRVYMSPSEDTFLLPGSTITFKIWRSLQCSDTGKTEVPLSEDGYLLVAESRAYSYDSDQRAEVIEVDRHTVTAKNLGKATLRLTHQSLAEDSVSLLPSHSVFVVEPSYLTLDLEEETEDRWVLETGRQYHVTVRIHDSHGHITHMSENVELALSAGDHVQVVSSSSDLFSHALLAQSPGHTLLQATLLTVLSEDGYALPLDLPIRVKQEVDVYDPLTVEPSVSVFPWQPSSSKPYHYLIKVRGGSGSVVWGVSDTSVATVTIKGEVIAGNRIGQAEILAADARKPLHTAVGQVHVLRPGQLKLLPQRGDCWVGESVELPLAVWGVRIPDLPHHSPPVPERHVASTPPQHTHTHHTAPQHTHTPHSPGAGDNLLPASDCSHLNVHVHTHPQGVFSPLPGSLPPSADSCGGVRLEALAPGHTLITVTVETDQYNISAMATLAAYSPLKALVSDVLLTVGVSRVLLFEGGPQPWPLDHSRFYAKAWAEPQGGVTVEPLSHSETGRLGLTYRVTCTAEGEQRVMFRCGNSAGELSWALCEEEVGVQVWCGAAAHVSITPLLTTTQPSTCPPPQYPSTPLAVSSTRDTVLQVAVFDHKGEQFDNFTFSSLVWSSSNPSLLSLPPEPTLVDIIDIPNEKKQYKVHGRLVCQAHGQTGAVTVTAQIYWSSVGGSVTLRLVEDVQWASRSITLYNHPLVTENLTLVQGSGHFVVSLQDKELANVTYLEKTNTVQVSSLRAGISSLKVYDLCLTPVDRGSTMAISVSDITDFRIDFMDIVEVGHSALVRVQVLDSHQQPFLHHFLSLMDLKLLPSSSIITVESVGPLDKVSVGFRIFGQAVGVATLHLSVVDRNGAVIHSAHKHMQVYPQFTLQPRKLSLALRSIRQVKWEGGPHPQSSVGFSVSDSDIAMVTDTGLVKGVSVGVARLRGALETILQDTGALLTFAQDEVEVEVFELTGVRIQAPLVRLTVGTEMPVYVMGSDSSQSPLSLGSVESGLSFHWSLGKLGVLEIIPRHTRAGISVSHTHSFSVLVRAWAAGRTTLKVCVRTSPTDSPSEDGRSHCPFSDEIHILVFEEMKLAAGSPQSILMSPHSTYSLQSNKDSICPMRYTLHQSVQGHGLVTVDDQGVLKAGSKTGAALLEVIATETCGVNQTLLISVKVAAVWFVRVFSDSTLHSEREASLPAFPLGWSIHIRARCYDNLGQEFHAHDIPICITTNRDDLVQITPGSDSHSFVVQTVSPGLTVLGVQGDATNPSLSDYTPLPVLPAISDPPASVQPGDVICFSSPLTGQQGQPGTWNVSSSRILQIDTNTGVALAKHAGTVVLYYWLGVGQQALKEVTVEPLATPTLTPPKDTHLTNWPQAPGYVVNVDLNTSVANSAQCSVDQSEAIQQRLKPEEELLCSLHFSAPYQQLKTLQSVFSTTPQYNRDTGQYSCRVSVRPESDAALPILSTLPLSASLSAGLRGQSAIPGLRPSSSSSSSSPAAAAAVVTLPYVPAFHCPHTQVSLSPRQPEAQITVQGVHHMLSTLKFYSESPAVSLSGPVVSEQEPALLKASVRTSHWHRPSDEAPRLANVTVYSSLFPQTHNITVTLLTDRRTRLAETSQTDAGVFSQLWDFQLILTFALFAVLAVTATLFIVYNTIVSQFTASPSANTAPTARADGKQLTLSPWIQSSPQAGRTARRRLWLWSART
ncbi:LOW QUALITY PROTEIN: nuclear pore membrane glycoprotein 210-like [Alosa alosa]|uniref:LOW QUALITY PROTEIN: nuclear pore membrane glycoprotein 210-like n=1 Tax=Alosa alosa TaxID=278164 RepID=UPI0020154229|nr:LOW QUALITY PROTEIN: nuclear pore membrane glycoprotein 210-like [Alosa alosa]